ENAARIVGAAQPRFPRPSDAVEDRGDAVRDRLAVAFHQRNVQGHMHAGTRHDLALEGIAVNIDDAGKDDEAASINGAAGTPLGADLGDGAVGSADVEV